MEHVRHERHLLKRGGLAVAIVVVLMLALVVPALAAPAPTSWSSVTPSTKTITYGQGVIITGTLMSNGAYIGGLWVDFAQATTQTGSYEVMYKVTSPSGPYATGVGEYSIAVMPAQTMYYRFVWAGDEDYLGPLPSNTVPILVKPALGKPSCPSSIKRNRTFTVKGTVKPGNGVTPKVKIKAYRRNGSGHYSVYRTYGTTISGTQYKARVKISKTGKYKFRAYTGQNAQFAANHSGLSRALTVRK